MRVASAASIRCWWVWIAIGALLLVVSIWFLWPRQADLRAFDPDEMAALETRMWRSYYDQHYLRLFVDLYRVSREQYGFSPWSSLRIATQAGRAARAFQPSRSREEAQVALPLLKRYYSLIAQGSGERFDALEAARLELDWWQLRREKKTWQEYGTVLAQVTAIVYGLPVSSVKPSAFLRAQMMDYRDSKARQDISEADWNHVEQGLKESWRLLKATMRESP